jgi:thiol-disulfide isomerase/thioredoxin
MTRFFLLVIVCLFVLSDVKSQSIERWKVDDLIQYMTNTDSALIVNFWATYCGPCIEELPYFHSLAEKYKGQKVKLLLVSLDFEEFYPERIRTFATKRNYTAQIVWLDEEKPDYFCPKIDVSWSGAMPATLFISSKKGYRKFVEAQLKPEELEEHIRKMLQ